MSNARQYTNHAIDLLEQGVLSYEAVVSACFSYMSEADVQDMLESNGFIEPDELEGDE